MIKKKKKKRVAKCKLNIMEVLIFKTLIDSSITLDEFVSVNIVLKEYDGMKEEIKYYNNK